MKISFRCQEKGCSYQIDGDASVMATIVAHIGTHARSQATGQQVVSK